MEGCGKHIFNSVITPNDYKYDQCLHKYTFTDNCVERPNVSTLVCWEAEKVCIRLLHVLPKWKLFV